MSAVTDPADDAENKGQPASEGTEPTYEQARAALADIVNRLESGDTTLEEALALWEAGEQWARLCSAWLDGAEARLGTDEED